MTDFRALCAELLEWAEHTSSHYYVQADVLVRARAALAEQPVGSTPIPMAERLPCLEDCDEQGWCWLWERDCGYNGRKWSLVDRAWSLSQSDEDLSIYTHWLPANALPTPDATVHD